jgi:hypothetical protein
MKQFFVQAHPCPECFGNVRWHARKCPHCEAAIAHADRFEWMTESAKLMFFATVTVLVSFAGWLCLWMVGLL